MTSALKTPRAILIAGPTASGKSALALAIAERIGGTIINADSMQVYRELRILTARPSAEDETRVPHRLYGHTAAREGYSAGRFVEEASAAIGEAQSAGRVPIVTGGTGLYFKALLEGLSPIPPIKQAVRDHWRSEAERLGAEALHVVLSQRDPVMAARLRPSDPQRLVRALEVLESTGRSLADWQAEPGTPAIAQEAALRLVVDRPRPELWALADARFDAMMREGALEEVRQLSSLQLGAALPAMRALGVAPLLDHIAGRSMREAAVAKAKTDTRQFIKRQLTWLNGHMIAWHRCSAQDMETTEQLVMPFIQS